MGQPRSVSLLPRSCEDGVPIKILREFVLRVSFFSESKVFTYHRLSLIFLNKCDEISSFIASTHSFRFLYHYLTSFFTASVGIYSSKGRLG
jgi:hypothetical protein